MNPTASSEKLTVLYDGACPLCKREIAHVKRLAEGESNSELCFVDISTDPTQGEGWESKQVTLTATERAKLLARFHVQRADGSRMDGAAAFVAMWERLPGWRWLAKFSRLPGMLSVMEFAYRGFLTVRPQLQKLARRLEPSAKVD
jgi:ubiquinone biosynthesis monooxygenase Coq7